MPNQRPQLTQPQIVPNSAKAAMQHMRPHRGFADHFIGISEPFSIFPANSLAFFRRLWHNTI
jgi:hypothetical protein